MKNVFVTAVFLVFVLLLVALHMAEQDVKPVQCPKVIPCECAAQADVTELLIELHERQTDMRRDVGEWMKNHWVIPRLPWKMPSSKTTRGR